MTSGAAAVYVIQVCVRAYACDVARLYNCESCQSVCGREDLFSLLFFFLISAWKNFLTEGDLFYRNVKDAGDRCL